MLLIRFTDSFENVFIERRPATVAAAAASAPVSVSPASLVVTASLKGMTGQGKSSVREGNRCAERQRVPGIPFISLQSHYKLREIRVQLFYSSLCGLRCLRACSATGNTGDDCRQRGSGRTLGLTKTARQADGERGGGVHPHCRQENRCWLSNGCQNAANFRLTPASRRESFTSGGDRRRVDVSSFRAMSAPLFRIHVARRAITRSPGDPFDVLRQCLQPA